MSGRFSSGIPPSVRPLSARLARRFLYLGFVATAQHWAYATRRRDVRPPVPAQTRLTNACSYYHDVSPRRAWRQGVVRLTCRPASLSVTGWKSDRDLGGTTGLESARLAASCLKHCADQMELERARDLLRRERVRIEQALARVSVPGREELAGQDEMADAASQLYEEEFDEGQADDLRAELAAVERAEPRLLDGT